jgi:hypothetical protein
MPEERSLDFKIDEFEAKNCKSVYAGQALLPKVEVF